MRKILLFICLAGTMLSACDPSTRETETTVEGVLFQGYEVTPYSLYKTAGDCSSDTSRTCTRVNVEYPVFADSSFLDAAERINADLAFQAANNNGLDSLPYTSIDAMADDFLSDYAELQADFPEAFGWQLNINGEVLRNDGQYVVVKMESSSYTGGAHGNVSTQFSNYYAVTGNKISLLNNLALESFKKERGLLAGEDPAAIGFTFENNRYFNPDNFALLDNEIVFYFNHYEIAPYSEGPTEIRVPLAAMSMSN